MLISNEFVKAEHRYRAEWLRPLYGKTRKLDQVAHTAITAKVAQEAQSRGGVGSLIVLIVL